MGVPGIPDRRVLVLAQAGLGGLTVEHSLAEELVAAHLGTAMVLLALLLWLGAKAHSEVVPSPAPPWSLRSKG